MLLSTSADNTTIRKNECGIPCKENDTFKICENQQITSARQGLSTLFEPIKVVGAPKTDNTAAFVRLSNLKKNNVRDDL
jgi:hypothetical protein